MLCLFSRPLRRIVFCSGATSDTRDSCVIDAQWRHNLRHASHTWETNEIFADNRIQNPAYFLCLLRRSLTTMLIVVSSYSIAMNAPRLVSQCIQLTDENISSTWSFFFFQYWSNYIIMPFNYCGSFIFYVLSGQQFRQELLRLFCCRKTVGK